MSLSLPHQQLWGEANIRVIDFYSEIIIFWFWTIIPLIALKSMAKTRKNVGNFWVLGGFLVFSSAKYIISDFVFYCGNDLPFSV